MASIPMRARFSHPAPTVDKVDKLDRMAEMMAGLGDEVERSLAPGREKSLVFTKLEEAMMWARIAVARE